VNVRQNDFMKNKHRLQNVNRKYRKTNLSSSSLLRMFSVYWGSTQVKLTGGKRPTNMNQSSVSDSDKQGLFD
jgi:hypothetical protein